MNIASLAVLCAMLVAPVLVAAEPLSPQDHAEIQQLYARYNHAIDSGNAEAWAATFTADGVFNDRFTGREALIGFANNFKANGPSRRHWNSNLTLTATTHGAQGSVCLLLLDVGVKPAAIMASGVYADELVKTADGWRFKSRVVKLDGPVQPVPPAVDKPK
jgi:SnoaL-like domain